MDKKKSILNVTISVLLKIVTIVLTLFVVKGFDQIPGGLATGYNSLFKSITSVLGLAEAGFCGGVSFCLYKSIINNDKNKISAFYCFLKKAYRYIFVIFLVLGCIVGIFLPFLDKNAGGDYSKIDWSIYLSYFLYIFSTSFTYLFSFKGVVIAAYKDNFKKDICVSSGIIVEYIISIILSYVFKSFLISSLSLIVGTFITCFLYSFIFNKDHKEISNEYNTLENDEKKVTRKLIISSFIHAAGEVIVYSTDAIIISAFLGSDVLGDYYHYSSIINALFTLATTAFTSLTPVVGHYLGLKSNVDKEKLLRNFYVINFLVGNILFLGFYGASESFVCLVYGSSKNISWYVIVALTFCYFIRFMQRSVLVFRDAGGSFTHDIYKPILESVINLALDFILVNYLGIFGVLLATICVNVFISHTIEPTIFYKYTLEKKPYLYMVTNYTTFIIFGLEGIAMYYIKNAIFPILSPLWSFLLLGVISVVMAFIISLVPLFYVKRANKRLIYEDSNNL